MIEQLRLGILIATLTIVSGVCDSYGFTYAAAVWREGNLQWKELAKSASGFASGISIYWITIRYFNQAGIVSAELQTLLWFGTTLVGVALLSGKFLHWPVPDQAVAALVLVGIGWLLVRTGG